MEIHLDLVGGLAGDMFIAALLDAFPHHEAAVQQAIRSVSDRCPVACASIPHNDTVIQGHRFEVNRLAASPGGAVCGPCRDQARRLAR